MAESSKIEISVSNRTIIRVLLVIMGFFLTFRFISNAASVLQLIFASFFLSLALNPAVGWLTKQLHLKSRAVATGIAYVAVLLVLSIFVIAVVPPFVSQTINYVKHIPIALNNLQDDSTSLALFVDRYNLQGVVDSFGNKIANLTTNLQEPVLTTASKIGNALISIVTVLVLTFMMLVEGPILLNQYWQIHPKRRQQHDQELALKMYHVVTGYVNGQLVLAAIAATMVMFISLISSTLLGVSINALALAGIIFITGLIPMIGNLVGGIIVVLACLLVSLPLALIIAGYILIHQQIENITLQPYIQSKYNQLTPLTVFIAAMLGIGFGGLLGAFVAIPAAGCSKILLKDFLERRNK